MAAAIPPLRFDPLGLPVPGAGAVQQQLAALHPQLDAARRSLLEREQSTNGDQSGRAAGLLDVVDPVEQPDRIIADYRAHRQRSELGRVLATARRLAETVDRVVVVADAATLRAVRALVEACSHPYHNELSRAERGGQPRMYFAGDSLDNDALAGLLDLMGQDCHLTGPQGSWGLILIESDHEPKAHEPQALCAARGVLLAELEKSTGGDRRHLGRRCVTICRRNSLLEHFAQESGCDRFDLAAGAGGQRSLFDAAGLLPAATLGIDVRRLLEGAARLNAHFRAAPPAENLVLGYAGACRLMQAQFPPRSPRLVAWAAGLGAFARWQNELSAANDDSAGLRPIDCGTFPLNLLVDAARSDRIRLAGAKDGDLGESLPDMLAASVFQARQRAAGADRPWAALHLPRLDEPTVGQLFQMFLLATALAPRSPAGAEFRIPSSEFS